MHIYIYTLCCHTRSKSFSLQVSAMWTFCSYCIVEFGNLRHCPCCKTVYYCCKECSRLHWREHKPQCVGWVVYRILAKEVKLQEAAILRINKFLYA